MPTLVIFGCAFSVTVFALPSKLPTNVVAITLPALMFPITSNAIKLPTLVIFGCALSITVFALPDIFPTNLLAITLPSTRIPLVEIVNMLGTPPIPATIFYNH